MASIPNVIEILAKIPIAWVGCTNVTDRRQTADGRSMTYSESLKINSVRVLTKELVWKISEPILCALWKNCWLCKITYLLTYLYTNVVVCDCTIIAWITREIDLTVALYTVDLSRTQQGATWSDIISCKTVGAKCREISSFEWTAGQYRGHAAEVNPLRIRALSHLSGRI